MIMMGDKPKGAISSILGPDPKDAPPDEGGDSLKMIAEDLLSAIEAKDAGAVADALSAAYAECGSEPGE